MSLGSGARTWGPLWLAGLCALCALSAPPALAQERLPASAAAAAATVTAPVTATVTASVERGRALLANRQDSGCILCHTVPGMAAGGEIGPPLAGLAGRASAEQIRQRIADPRTLNPATVMPAYFSTQGLQRVASAYAGQTVLSAQGLEDIVAYLLANTRSEPGAPVRP
jgi:sulfur-oxidizing protein SoxX